MDCFSQINDEAREYFKKCTPKMRSYLRAQYVFLIAIEEEDIQTAVSKINGRRIQFQKMPHMLPLWKKGLEVLEKIIQENN